MSSVKLLNDTIAEKQRGMEAIQNQIQKANDKQDYDLAQSLQAQLQEFSRQIADMQAELPGALEKEKQEAEEKAREEQKKKDKGIGMSDFF